MWHIEDAVSIVGQYASDLNFGVVCTQELLYIGNFNFEDEWHRLHATRWVYEIIVNFAIAAQNSPNAYFMDCKFDGLPIYWPSRDAYHWITSIMSCDVKRDDRDALKMIDYKIQNGRQGISHLRLNYIQKDNKLMFMR